MQTCTHKQVEQLSKINKANVSAPQNLLLQLSPRNFSGIFLGCQVSEWLGHICKILNVFPEIAKETQYSFQFRFGGGMFRFLNHLQLYRVCKSLS